MYFFKFSSTITEIARYIIKERKLETANAYRQLVQLQQQFGGELDKATSRKIAVSHGIYNPMIIDAFCRLHGRVSTTVERTKLVHYFTCSSLLDNFIDEHTLSENEIEAVCLHPETYEAKNFDDRVFKYCHELLLGQVNDRTAYWQVFENELKAQQQSIQQFEATITNEEIESIMQRKGGNAVMMCRYYLDIKSSPAEEQCWQELGAMIQLTNDLFDIYKDLQDGIHTLATRTVNAYEMERYISGRIENIRQLIKAIPADKKTKFRFSCSMAGVYAFALIAVNQLKQLQHKKEQLPAFSSLPRKALIIDMEKPKNIMRWFRYVYRYARV